MDTLFARSGEVSLAYSVLGDGPETVLLLMGLGGRAADWGTSFPAALSRRFRVVLMDNRGVGFSPKAPGGYEMTDLAKDAVAVLDAVGAPQAHLVGVSMGGMIAQTVAIHHPERVKKLVLLSTHFGGPRVVSPHPDALKLFDPSEVAGRQGDPVAMMKFTIATISAPGFMERSPDVVDALLQNVARAPTHPAAFMAQLQALLTSDRSEAVKTIDRPTLVVHGTDDKLVPAANGENLAAAIPRAELALLEDGGHMLMWERPEALARLVLDFLG